MTSRHSGKQFKVILKGKGLQMQSLYHSLLTSERASEHGHKSKAISRRLPFLYIFVLFSFYIANASRSKLSGLRLSLCTGASGTSTRVLSCS